MPCALECVLRRPEIPQANSSSAFAQSKPERQFGGTFTMLLQSNLINRTQGIVRTSGWVRSALPMGEVRALPGFAGLVVG